MRRDRILWVILAVSAALRFWKIDGDLPYVFHYDEPTLVDNAVWMLQNRTLNPHFFNYPTGLIYLLAALFGLLLFWGTVFGQFASWKGALAWLSTHTYPRPPEGGVLYFYPTIGVPVLYLIGRMVSASAGIAAVAILYAAARRAGGSAGLARLAALMLAISPLAVEHSHLITTDMTATMLATACLLVAMQAEGGGRSLWVKAGILGGLAAGVKYNAGLVAVMLVLLAGWKWRAQGRKVERRTGGHGQAGQLGQAGEPGREPEQGTADRGPIGQTEQAGERGRNAKQRAAGRGQADHAVGKADHAVGQAEQAVAQTGQAAGQGRRAEHSDWANERARSGMSEKQATGRAIAGPGPAAHGASKHRKTGHEDGDRRRIVQSLLLAGLAAAAAFLVTTPFALLDFAHFVKDLGHEVHRVGSIPTPFRGAEEIAATPGEKLAGVFWHNLGVFGIVAAIWGAVLAIRSRTYARVAVVAWVAIAVLPQLRWWSFYPRYLLLAWPAILLLAAWGIEDAARRAAAVVRGVSRPREFATVALAVLVLAPGTLRLIKREARRARPDPRVEMTEWIEENIPYDSWVVVESAGAFPSNARFKIDQVDFLGRATPEEYLARGIRFLAASGGERLVEGKEPYRSVEENLRRIRESADVPWSDGKYAIYFLRGEISWEEAVDQAMAQGDFGRARTALEEAARSGSGTPYLYNRLAKVCLQVQDTTAAMDAFREAARLDTTDVEPHLALGDFALRRGDWERSLQELEAARRISPRAPTVFHNLAVTYLYRARDRIRSGNREGGRADWLLARESAATCAKTSPGDSTMVQVLEQVERMGKRWGFIGGGVR